jgi:hypothetical protein
MTQIWFNANLSSYLWNLRNLWIGSIIFSLVCPRL